MQINLAFRIWEGDHDNKYPMAISVTNYGGMELITTGNVAGCLLLASNELSTPKILICPADNERIPASTFATNFSNANINYFINPDANEDDPQYIMDGDDNLAIDGVAVNSGVKEFPTNMPISFTAARHKFVGNIGFADGSVSEVSSSGLQAALVQSGIATNRLAIP